MTSEYGPDGHGYTEPYEPGYTFTTPEGVEVFVEDGPVHDELWKLKMQIDWLEETFVDAYGLVPGRYEAEVIEMDAINVPYSVKESIKKMVDRIRELESTLAAVGE
jgi:hypothetical protein